MPGKFIVIEGIDAAGKETQSKMLAEFLEKQGKKMLHLSYPDKASPIWKLIREYLKKVYDFPLEVQFLLYATDMAKDINRINGSLKNGGYVVADRYITSAFAYQCSQGFPLEKALKFAELFGFPKPDQIIYLKISPTTGIERKTKENGDLDRNEANEKLLAAVSEMYGKLAKENVFGKWIVIDGEKSREEVFENMRKALGL